VVTDADERTGKATGREIQRGGKVLLTLGKPGVAGDGPGHLQPAVGRAHRSERRYFRRGRTRRRFQRAHREVLEAESYKDLGQEGKQIRGEVRHSSRPRHGFQGAAVRRRPRQQPHPDLRPEGISSKSGSNSAGQAGLFIDRNDTLHVRSPVQPQAQPRFSSVASGNRPAPRTVRSVLSSRGLGAEPEKPRAWEKAVGGPMRPVTSYWAETARNDGEEIRQEVTDGLSGSGLPSRALARSRPSRLRGAPRAL